MLTSQPPDSARTVTRGPKASQMLTRMLSWHSCHRHLPIERLRMTDVRDPAVKLFGSTIPMTDPGSDQEEICRGITSTGAKDPKPVVMEGKDQDQPIVSSILNDSHEDDKVTTDSKPEQDQSEADIFGQEKILKKPDIILPCPRCNSMNTKFCYYNNYNVSQPRYFCKNCQRYWTAGGAMRNVPVGAGRRKSKHSVSNNQSQSCVISDTTRPLNGNVAVLNFGPEPPQCEPMSSVLNVGERKKNAEMGSLASGENGKEPSCASSVTPSTCVTNDVPEKAAAVEQNGVHGCYNVFASMHPLQYSPAPPWPYWGPGWNDVAAMGVNHCSSDNGIPNPGPWVPPPMLAAPAFYPPAVPFPFMPAAYWAWPNGVWNVPWSGANCNSAYLGKHSRDGSEEEKSEKLWIPKTLRIDDPDEAAKSSIWSTLGIKPDESLKRRHLFDDIQSNDKIEGHASAPVQILHANPAALSRSQTFQENT